MNCQGEIHVPDDRTGMIHTDGRYGCFVNLSPTKEIWTGTVASDEKGVTTK